jgi:hypothetical protein
MRAQRSGESALLLLDVIDFLNREKVSYAVVRAMAASVHGIVRASMDADVVLALATHALPNLERRLRQAGFGTELRIGDTDDPIGAVLALNDEFGNRVDLLVGLRGLESRCGAVEAAGCGLRARDHRRARESARIEQLID